MNTLFTGHHIINLTTVDSTNNYAAKSLESDEMPDGTVIIADEQTQGKGQRGNNWQSEKGQNLTCSFFYRCTFLPAKRHFYLNIAACLAIRDFLGTYGLQGVVKWPNDVLVGGKKIAGILVETSLRGDVINHGVIGIGMNINQLKFPEEIKATSLFAQTGQKHDVRACLATLCECLEKRFLMLRAWHFDAVKEEFESNMLGKGQALEFQVNGDKLLGEVMGIDEAGRLVVKAEDTLQSFGLKEISFPA